MNQKNNRKWMAGALLLTAGLCFVPGKRSQEGSKSYGELTVCTGSPVVTIRGSFFHRKDAFGNRKSHVFRRREMRIIRRSTEHFAVKTGQSW